MRASCVRRFGFVGARVAIMAGPLADLRDMMKSAAKRVGDDIALSPVGGPWAADSAPNRGSYCFNFDGISLEEADEWIEAARRFGIRQIDFHGGRSFRFGDCRPDPAKYPNGYADLKKVIDKIHAAGMLAGLHTYAFFLDKNSEWCAPVPREDLGWSRTYTLAAPIGPEDDRIPVVESTEDASTIVGFFEHNSLFFRIGTELIAFSGIDKTPPYAFTGCKRGARGTSASAHGAGELAFHLKECFGLFTPGIDTPLFDEVCARTAEIYNECGFDMMYHDALDGEAILAGAEYAWHYGSKFIFDIVRRLRRPAIIEYSTHHHHLWYTRSRMGAWDTPTRSYKRFIDIHVASDRLVCDRQYLPGHLGWWAVNPHETIRAAERATQYERMFEDDIEYLCCKCAAHGYSLSMMGIEPSRVAGNPGAMAYAAMTKAYEDLRNAGRFGEETRARLAEPGADFSLRRDGDDWRIAPVEYVRHKTDRALEGSAEFDAPNRFAAQGPFVRIEALMAAGTYEGEGTIPLTGGPGRIPASETVTAAEGCALQTEWLENGTLAFTARNDTVDPAGRWVFLSLGYPSPIDLGQAQALGVWILGDGGGEILSFQLASPPHLTHGHSDHLVRVDFTGWKYHLLVENDGGKMPDAVWPPEFGDLYATYREGTHFNAIASLRVWCTNIRSRGVSDLRIRPVLAIPVLPGTVRAPSLSAAGRRITFDTTLVSGEYLEYDPAVGSCRKYDRLGALLGEPPIIGGPLTLDHGVNRVRMDGGPDESPPPRAAVTLRFEGTPSPVL
jgi:hypothetical protein